MDASMGRRIFKGAESGWQARVVRHLQMSRAPLQLEKPHTTAISRHVHLSTFRMGLLVRALADPTATGRQEHISAPEPEANMEQEFGGGGGDGGWKSPPGGSGRGNDDDRENWWERYCSWWEQHSPFSRVSLGVRMRIAADPSFAFKLMVECGLDASIILTVNVLARRERFISELEFVLSQVAVSLLNDFALVYLLAPTPECSVLRRGSLQAKLAELPAHVFQQSPTGLARSEQKGRCCHPANALVEPDRSEPCRGYTVCARVLCFLAKAVQYGGVGLVMGVTGSSLVLGLTSVRSRFDDSYKPPPTYQPVLGTGIGWLLFMSGSSNLRYNLINLVEDFAYERFSGPRSKVLSVGLRFSNNIFGAHAWMQLAKALKLNRPREMKAGGKGLKSSEGEEVITEMPPLH